MLKLDDSNEYCILELGMSGFGEILELQSICLPSVRVVTNVGLAHLEGVGGTIDGVARAKGELVSSARVGDTCVLNLDDDHVAAMAAMAPKGVKLVTFGRTEECDVRILSSAPGGQDGMKVIVKFEIRGIGVLEADIYQPGYKHVAENAAAAIATLVALNVPFDCSLLRRGLSTFKLQEERRGSAREYFWKGKAITVIDMSYNSNPTSMTAAFSMLVGLESGVRKHLALGDMLELGNASEEQHLLVLRQCVKLLEERKIHSVGLVGERFHEAILRCREETRGGLHYRLKRVDHSIQSALKPETLAESMASLDAYEEGDVVLVMGSRSVMMENFIEEIGFIGGF